MLLLTGCFCSDDVMIHTTVINKILSAARCKNVYVTVIIKSMFTKIVLQAMFCKGKSVMSLSCYYPGKEEHWWRGVDLNTSTSPQDEHLKLIICYVIRRADRLAANVANLHWMWQMKVFQIKYQFISNYCFQTVTMWV